MFETKFEGNLFLKFDYDQFRTATIRKEKTFKSTKKIVETKRRDVYNSTSSDSESDDFRNPMFPSL